MKRTALFSLLFSLSLLLAACGSDDPNPPGNGGNTGGGDTGGNTGGDMELSSQSYNLGPQAYLDVDGDATVTFQETANGSTEVTIDFGGEIGTDFPLHPAHIHMNDVAEGGDIAIDLEPVDDATGVSTTTVTNFNGEDGTAGAGDAITYEDLVAYDGYVNVHLSLENIDVVFASANIGANADVALPPVPTIAEQATAAGNFTILLAALEAADLTSTFTDAAAGPFTVLAPTDEAFAALLAELEVSQEELLGLDNLADILSYHVLPSVLVRTQVVAAAESDTSGIETLLADATLSLATDDGNIVINDRAQVIVDSTNIATANGVVHAIDTVLLPPEETDGTDN